MGRIVYEGLSLSNEIPHSLPRRCGHFPTPERGRRLAN
jgi:hypothetical protein